MWPTRFKEWRNRLFDSTFASEAGEKAMVANFSFLCFNLNVLLPMHEVHW